MTCAGVGEKHWHGIVLTRIIAAKREGGHRGGRMGAPALCSFVKARAPVCRPVVKHAAGSMHDTTNAGGATSLVTRRSGND